MDNNKSASLQELAHQAWSRANLQSGSEPQESVHSRPEHTNACNRNSRRIMNVESASSYERLIESVNNRDLTLQQLLTIAERLMAASDQSPTDLTSTTVMDQIPFCRVCLNRAHKTLKCLHNGCPETFIGVRNGNFRSRPSGRTNNRRSGHAVMDLQK